MTKNKGCLILDRIWLFIVHRPPIVMFWFCLLGFLIVLLNMRYTIKTEQVVNPDRHHDWNVVIKSLSSLEFCLSVNKTHRSHYTPPEQKNVENSVASFRYAFNVKFKLFSANNIDGSTAQKMSTIIRARQFGIKDYRDDKPINMTFVLPKIVKEKLQCVREGRCNHIIIPTCAYFESEINVFPPEPKPESCQLSEFMPLKKKRKLSKKKLKALSGKEQPAPHSDRRLLQRHARALALAADRPDSAVEAAAAQPEAVASQAASPTTLYLTWHRESTLLRYLSCSDQAVLRLQYSLDSSLTLMVSEADKQIIGAHLNTLIALLHFILVSMVIFPCFCCKTVSSSVQQESASQLIGAGAAASSSPLSSGANSKSGTGNVHIKENAETEVDDEMKGGEEAQVMRELGDNPDSKHRHASHSLASSSISSFSSVSSSNNNNKTRRKNQLSASSSQSPQIIRDFDGRIDGGAENENLSTSGDIYRLEKLKRTISNPAKSAWPRRKESV